MQHPRGGCTSTAVVIDFRPLSDNLATSYGIGLCSWLSNNMRFLQDSRYLFVQMSQNTRKRNIQFTAAGNTAHFGSSVRSSVELFETNEMCPTCEVEFRNYSFFLIKTKLKTPVFFMLLIELHFLSWYFTFYTAESCFIIVYYTRYQA